MPTQISRSELLQTVKLTEPALGTGNQVIQQFSMLWFEKDSVRAYNDDIGVVAYCKSDIGIEGGINGGSLLAVLQSSKAQQVHIECDKNQAKLRLTNTNVKFALAEPKDAVWSMPKGNEDHILRVKQKDLREAVKHCLRSVGNNPSLPESLGITFEVSKGQVTLYSTNDKSFCRVKLKVSDTPKFERVTVHKSFCEQLLTLGGEAAFDLELTNEHALLFTRGAELFGRTLSSDRPIDFEHLVSSHSIEGKNSHVATPNELKAMLERSLIFCNDHPKVSLDVGAAKMTIASKSELGQMRDSVSFKGHPDIGVMIDPRDVRAGCDLDSLAITEKAIVMKGSNSLYVVSTLGTSKGKTT